MLTTGIKEVIVNSISDIDYNAATDTLKISGSPEIKASEVTKLSVYQAKSAVPGVYSYTFTAPTGAVAAGDSLVFGIKMQSYREQGEFSSDRKYGNDPLVLQAITTAADGAGVATALYTAINAMTDELKARYRIANATNPSAGVVRIMMSEWSVYPMKIDVNSYQGADLGVTYVRTVDIAADEGRGLPLYMIENVKYDTMGNRSAYGMDSLSQINLNTTYALMAVEVTKASFDTVGVISGALANKTMRYNFWIDNVIDLAAAELVGAASNTPDMFYTDAAGTTAAFATTQGDATTNQENFAKGVTSKIYISSSYI